MTTDETEAATAAIARLVEQIKPMLAGRNPAIQGGALADLLSMWIAGHHPALRDEVLAAFIASVEQLTRVNEKILFGERGFPDGRLT